MVNFLPARVVDISPHNNVTSFGEVAKSGVWGVINKATEGTTYVDPTYASRRPKVKASGMLWGAYHFNTGGDVTAQVDWFMLKANPDADTLMVLDYEDNPSSSNM